MEAATTAPNRAGLILSLGERITLKELKDMPVLGAHQSIAGGYYRAAERARAVGCDCVQVFTWHLSN